ncbi:3-keto-5-aminohexanoate cleavage protein [Roseovarius sp. MMSF_3281]|uniref:3-keto-5-aminohexanoate cleavage protein n=1 Tax=Roseovarius sp. MMSF_3281 TaxID=3046694 RepID=UPI00273EC88D|nr:3-keto-5-aminohexanoate cleavage protein [Roseovarius sp. MMSF_3281]
MTGLPYLMVAPNGARRTKADHPALPMTLPEIVATAKACSLAGADGLHLHLRDSQGCHLLDSGAYREALSELHTVVPEMTLQITTEAAGRYAAPHQRAVALEAGAGFVSIALREMVQDTEDSVVMGFYQECHARGIAVQHILYDASDFDLLSRLLPDELLRSPGLQMIFVLGRYSKDQDSNPDDLTPFLARKEAMGLMPDWAVCAFGRGETDCLCEAHRRGGKLRVGFENSLWNADGGIAQDNAERVRQMRAACLR